MVEASGSGAKRGSVRCFAIALVSASSLALACGSAALAQSPPATPNGGPPPLPQTPPSLPAVKYYFNDNGKPSGAVSLQDIEAKIKTGQITRTTLVWRTGQDGWKPAKDITEVAALFVGGAPAIPAEDKFKRLLVGTWETEPVATDFGNGARAFKKVNITYAEDGTFRGAQIMAATLGDPNMPGASNATPLSGTWKVQGISASSFTLTLEFSGLGSQSTRLSVIDDNTLQVEDGSRLVSHRISR